MQETPIEPAADAARAETGEAPPSPMLAPKRARPRRTVTGGLKNLPVCPPANELLNRALRISKWLKVYKSGGRGEEMEGVEEWRESR